MYPLAFFERLYFNLHTVLTILALSVAVVVTVAILYRAWRRRL